MDIAQPASEANGLKPQTGLDGLGQIGKISGIAKLPKLFHEFGSC